MELHCLDRCHFLTTVWVGVRATASMLSFWVWYSFCCYSPVLYEQALPLLFISYYKPLCLGAVKVLTQSSGGKKSVSCPPKHSCFLVFQQFQSEAPGCHCCLMPCQRQLICSHWFVAVRLAEYAVLLVTATINICVAFPLILLTVTSDMHLRRDLQHFTGQRRTLITLFTRGITLLHHRDFTSLLHRSTASWRRTNTVLKSQSLMARMWALSLALIATSCLLTLQSKTGEALPLAYRHEGCFWVCLMATQAVLVLKLSVRDCSTTSLSRCYLMRLYLK